MTETLRWRPQRTRVYDPRVLDNPWFRDGWRAKEDRDFFASLSGRADRQEEDEDFEVLAPIRPTRRHVEHDETVLKVDDWFDPELANSMRSMDAEYDVGYGQTRDGQRRLLSSNRELGKKRGKTKPYVIRLEDNFEVLDYLDRSLNRSSESDCWLLYRHPSSRWALSASGERSVLCSDGKVRPTKLSRLIWVIEYGSIDSLMTMVARHPPNCLNPEHYTVRIRKE